MSRNVNAMPYPPRVRNSWKPTRAGPPDLNGLSWMSVDATGFEVRVPECGDPNGLSHSDLHGSRAGRALAYSQRQTRAAISPVRASHTAIPTRSVRRAGEARVSAPDMRPRSAPAT